MKRFLTPLILAGAAMTAPALAQNVCIDSRDIVSSKSDDGKTMVFRMRDGKIYVNHLQGICPDLKFNGFSWVLHGDTQICEREQTLRVIQSGQICTLGKFDPPTTRMKGTN